MKETRELEPARIILSGIWVALMLTYLLGDVLRIFAGDFAEGEMAGMEGSQAMYLLAALVMLIPIVMVLLSLALKYRPLRWLSIGAAGFLFLFNLVGLPGYPGLYDQFLIVVGLGFNVLTIWYAWRWVGP
jgi:hypothetical protein